MSDTPVEDVPQEIVETVRGFSTPIVVGMCLFSATAGVAIGFEIARRRLETKYSKIAEEEIEAMREHYQEKARSLEAQAAKRPVEEIVKERGYSSSEVKTSAPPMAVQPPPSVVDNEEEEEDEDEEELEEGEGPVTNVPVPPLEPVRNIFREAEVTDTWDWHEERRKRSPEIPYIIHVDERHEMEGYSEMTLTHYDIDDVLCNERDEIVDPDKRDELIGKGTLDKFGHGSQDASIVYVRNDPLEIVFEIVKSPNSFAEEVHGFTHEGYYRGNLERMRKRERDDQEE